MITLTLHQAAVLMELLGGEDGLTRMTPLCQNGLSAGFHKTQMALRRIVRQEEAWTRRHRHFWLAHTHMLWHSEVLPEGWMEQTEEPAASEQLWTQTIETSVVAGTAVSPPLCPSVWHMSCPPLSVPQSLIHIVRLFTVGCLSLLFLFTDLPRWLSSSLLPHYLFIFTNRKGFIQMHRLLQISLSAT